MGCQRLNDCEQRGWQTTVPSDAACQRDENRLGEQLAQNVPPAGTDGEPDGQFAAAVRGARGEDAGQIGAGRQQHQQSQYHDCRRERAVPAPPSISPIRPGLTRRARRRVVSRRDSPGSFDAAMAVQIVRRLLRRDARLERADDEEAVVAALGEKIVALDLLLD